MSKLILSSDEKKVLDIGFAGTVQAFAPFDLLEEFRAGMDAALGEGACHVLSIRTHGGVEMEANV